MCDLLMVDVVEAGRRLRLGRSTLYELLRRGDLPSVKVGNCRRILVADLVDYVTRLKEQAPAYD